MSRPPRVALVSNLCPHYRRELYEVLAERVPLECFFFAEREPFWNPMLTAVEEGAFERVSLRRVTVLGEPFLPGLARRLSRRRYDAVIVGLVGRIMAPYAALATRLRGLPLVVWTGTWHHPETVFHRLTHPLVRRLYRSADALLAYGDHVRRFLTTVEGVDDRRIFTAAQAVDGSRFATDSDPASSRQLLFVGQFQPWKGIGTLLEALARVDDPTLSLTFAGNGPLESEIRAAAARDPRIRVAGHVPQEQLPGLFGAGRCLVLPSETTAAHRETWGLVANEAMHAGLPVIASDAVGAAAHGLVEDGATGLVVPEGDPAALAAALATLGRDDALAARLGDGARRRVAGYTYGSMADSFEAAIEFAVSHHG